MPHERPPLVVTGRAWVSGALANLFPSRALVQPRVQTGDMKLWCHLRHQKGKKRRAPVWAGQFRAAIYDGKGWRTFRLNIVADTDARYETFDERTQKAQRCFLAIAKLRQQQAHWRETSYGCTFTLAAPQEAPQPQPVAQPLTAACTSQQPATGSEAPSKTPRQSGSSRKGRQDNGQLYLFEM